MATIAIHGRTYWDVELDLLPDSLAQGKGKVDTEIRIRVGGFACNAARAIRALFPSVAVRIVTVVSPLDMPRLRAGLPDGVAIDPLCSDDPSLAWPAISVVINPATSCRILRDRQESTDHLWQLGQVADDSLAADLHLLGRLPAAFAADLLERARRQRAKLAWVGGDSLPERLEREFDIVCVNGAEAARMLGVARQSPRASAEALAQRASAPGAVRVVTGAGSAPTAAAVFDGAAVRCHEAPLVDVAPAEVATLLGVGDVFAACFVAGAALDSTGAVRESFDVAGALATAQQRAADFIRNPRHG